MFVFILNNCPVADPAKLWSENWKPLSEDILYLIRNKSGNQDLNLNDFDLENYALAEVEKLLNGIGKSLKNYPDMPFPEKSYMQYSTNRLIEEETGEGKIVLPIASSGIAATLLPGGRTSHSRFHIPLKLDHCSVAGIKHGSDIAELIKNTIFVIWDEAPMQHRHDFESVDRSFRDIMAAVNPQKKFQPFGGVTILFGGDFHQILPVILKASRAKVVNASLNQSKLWNFCKIFLLRTNMRLGRGKTEAENQRIAEFSKWVLNVGDGKIDNIHPENIFSDPEILIPSQFLIQNFTDSVKSIVYVTYPDFVNKFSLESYLRERAILTPTNAIVDQVNSQVLALIPGTTYTYLSQDSIDDECDGMDNDYESFFPVEYLNSINLPYIPKHELKLKLGAVVMLMRNLNQIMGLCNEHLFPRIEMKPTDTDFPFVFKRIQFPLQICFAMTINKSQGQSLDKVGLFLLSPPFSHDHLYVAVSRVTSPEGLHVLIEEETGKSSQFTANVVFDEVFYNLPVIDN
ncbi:uncharacterized protein LOC141673934 [Apium graveolens]|uniref:uncharacterized protein LOC141673934 n=1 Tax=Apium graveolens TaxID=4045 RepID=UPI003D7A5C16